MKECPQCKSPLGEKGLVRCPRCNQLLMHKCGGSCADCACQKKKELR